MDLPSLYPLVDAARPSGMELRTAEQQLRQKVRGCDGFTG
jgi:hypothetical protein